MSKRKSCRHRLISDNPAQIAVMPGLVPGHPRLAVGYVKDVDGRDEPGHDEFPISADVLEPNGGLRVKAKWRPAASYWHALLRPIPAQRNR
jgi:hypothetical protein